MDDSRETWRGIGLFIGLTAVVSSVFWYFIVLTGRLGAGHGLYVTGLMWSPGIAGLVVRYFRENTLRNHGWTWGRTRLQLLSYLIPIAYATPVYLVA